MQQARKVLLLNEKHELRRPARGRIPEHEVEMFISEFLDGASPRDIALQYNRTRDAVAAALERRGYDPERYSKFNEYDVDQWVALYTGDHDGVEWTINAIASGHGVGWSTVAIQLAARLGKLRHRRKAQQLAAERRKLSRH